MPAIGAVYYSVEVIQHPWWTGLIALGGAICLALCLAGVLWLALRKTGRPR